jgi:hypothetical protein
MSKLLRASVHGPDAQPELPCAQARPRTTLSVRPVSMCATQPNPREGGSDAHPRCGGIAECDLDASVRLERLLRDVRRLVLAADYATRSWSDLTSAATSACTTATMAPARSRPIRI